MKDRLPALAQRIHEVLLQQMATEIPGVRPAVISPATCVALEEYRGFRHVVRNVYIFQFDHSRVRRLVEQVRAVLDRLRPELLAFAHFLQQSATEADS